MQLKRVLLIQRRSLGDALYTALIAEVLKRKIPNISVDFLTLPFARDFFEAYLYLDKVIPFKGFWATLKEIRNQYDAILDYEATFRTYPLVLFSGAKIRSAFYRKKRERFLYPIYNRMVPVQFFNFTYWDRLKLLETISVDISDELNKLPLWEFKPEIYERYKNIHPFEEYIVISPKGVLPSKELAPEKVRELSLKLSETFNGKIIVAVAPNEVEYIKQLREVLPSNIEIFAKDLISFTLLLKGAKLLITIESFPYHLALLLRVPSIVIVQGYDIWFKNLFGLIHPYYPDLDCILCYRKKHCPYNFKCQREIDTDKIVEMATKNL